MGRGREYENVPNMKKLSREVKVNVNGVGNENEIFIYKSFKYGNFNEISKIK